MEDIDYGIKYYKIRLLKKLFGQTSQLRQELSEQLVVNATDPVIVKRRLRMLRQLNSYENQLVVKIQNFSTDDVEDIINVDFFVKLKSIVHPSL